MAKIIGIHSANKYQKKIMTSANTPSQMDFANLIIGKAYRLDVSAWMHAPLGIAITSVTLTGTHNASTLVQIFQYFQNNNLQPLIIEESGLSKRVTFVATATTITFTHTLVAAGSSLLATQTFAESTELDDSYVVTTDF